MINSLSSCYKKFGTVCFICQRDDYLYCFGVTSIIALSIITYLNAHN